MQNVKDLEFLFGIYVYNYCNSEETAKSGGKWVLDKLKNKSIDLPVYIDMEDNSIQNLGKEKLTNIVIAFNTMIENEGLWAGVYANLNWYNNFLNKEEIKKKYTTWIAHYTNEINKYQGEFDIWQNSSSGKIDGIKGNTDTNWLYRDLISEIKNTSIVITKTIEELANEVINGDWGNGEERKENLTNSGYNYEEIQAKVNEIYANKVEYYEKCNNSYSSIIDALKSINVDSSYSNRKLIAEKNNISNYSGTASQNIQLLKLLKEGKLIK